MENQKNNFAKNFTKKPFSDGLHHIAQSIKLLQNNDLEQSFLVLKNYLLISNARMLEGIANTLIMAMPISKQLTESLERLKLISKFDLALTLRTNKPLDYSNDLTGNIIKIMSARDTHVHPKIFDCEFSSIGIDPEAKQVDFALDEKKYLDIIPSTSKMFQFLDVFFIDWCKCDGPYLSSLLCESVKFADGNIGILQNLDLTKDKKIIESVLSIKIRFLSLIIQEQINIQQAGILDTKSHKQPLR